MFVIADMLRGGLLLCVILSVGSSLGVAASKSDAASGAQANLRMTPEKYAQYVRRFNAEDERYAELYSDDVVFDHGPVFGVLRGRQAIVDFYKDFWGKMHETLDVGAVVIDNEHGLMAAELSTHLVARKPGMTLPSHPAGMHVGDEFVTRGVVIYTLRKGKIVQIRGAVEGNSFNPAAASANRPDSAAWLLGSTRVVVELCRDQLEESANAGGEISALEVGRRGNERRNPPRAQELHEPALGDVAAANCMRKDGDTHAGGSQLVRDDDIAQPGVGFDDDLLRAPGLAHAPQAIIQLLCQDYAAMGQQIRGCSRLWPARQVPWARIYPA